MDWLRRNYMVVIVLGAIILSFFVLRSQNGAAIDADRRDNVQSCIRENSRSALSIAWEHQILAASSNNQRLTRPFEQIVRGTEAYLAIAQYVNDPSPATEVRTVRLENKTTARVLTKDATALIQKGCEMSFHAEPGSSHPPAIPIKGPVLTRDLPTPPKKHPDKGVDDRKNSQK